MRNWPIYFSALVFLVALFPACNEPTEIGIDVYPDPFSIKQDTLVVQSITVRENELASSSSSVYGVGDMNDPAYGKTTIGFYTQLNLGQSDVDFGDSPILDSAVLALDYQTVYGEETPNIKFQVFEVSSDLIMDSLYLSNQDIGYYPIPVGQLNEIVNIEDSVALDGVNVLPHVRIPLEPFFGQRLLDQSGTSNLENNEFFVNYMKGLLITADSSSTANDGGVVFFDLNSLLSKMTLYYHNAEEDSLSFDFFVGSTSVNFNNFEHNYSGSLVEAAINDPNPDNHQIVYIQSAAGVKARVSIPELEDYQNIAVTKATLVATQAYDPFNTDDRFAPSDDAIVFVAGDDGRNINIADLLFEVDPFYFEEITNPFTSSGYFSDDKTSVYFPATGDSLNQWRWNIGFHVQEVIDGLRENKDLYIASVPSTNSANRTILATENYPDSSIQMKLILQYTEID